eukprot:14630171-Alexandrium_andersonii.AAC.1
MRSAVARTVVEAAEEAEAVEVAAVFDVGDEARRPWSETHAKLAEVSWPATANHVSRTRGSGRGQKLRK